MTALTVAEVLRKAEQVIGERGWCQRALTGDAGSVCAVGAINYAATGNPFGADDYGDDDVATAAVIAFEHHLGRVIGDWNDEPGRTEAEVRAALLAAADKADQS